MALLKSYPTSAEGYRIELAQKSRLNEILKFCRDYYHDEETMCKSLKSGAGDVSDEESKLIEEDEDNTIVKVYESSPCLIAIHNETNEIVGLILTVLSNRLEDDESGSVSTTLFGSNTFKSTLGFMYYSYLAQIDTQAGIFNKYPNAEAALELLAIAVHKEHQQKGLAKDLSLIGIELAKNLPQVGVVFGVYTSIYSKKVAEKIGMKGIMDFDLEQDFINPDGNPAFPNTVPNNIVSVMAMEIDHE